MGLRLPMQCMIAGAGRFLAGCASLRWHKSASGNVSVVPARHQPTCPGSGFRYPRLVPDAATVTAAALNLLATRTGSGLSSTRGGSCPSSARLESPVSGPWLPAWIRLHRSALGVHPLPTRRHDCLLACQLRQQEPGHDQYDDDYDDRCYGIDCLPHSCHLLSHPRTLRLPHTAGTEIEAPRAGAQRRLMRPGPPAHSQSLIFRL